jgi:hypothetical protein
VVAGENIAISRTSYHQRRRRPSVEITLNPERWTYIWRMDKDKVAEILVEIGTLLELKGENPFKTRAYANAARTLEGLSEPLTTLVAEKRLGEIKGIGEALEQKITELVETGKLIYYDELKASIPPGLIEMLEISGLGPKKILIGNCFSCALIYLTLRG